MNMSKSRDIQAKMPSPKVIYASNESKSVLARNLEECRDNDKNSQSVFLSFKCIFARNCEGTEQLQRKSKRKRGQQLKMMLSPFFFYYLISAESSLNLGCMDVSISSKRIAS